MLVWIAETPNFQTTIFSSLMNGPVYSNRCFSALCSVFNPIPVCVCPKQWEGAAAFLETPHSCSDSYCSVFNAFCFCPFLAKMGFLILLPLKMKLS